jgi:putative flippase GtrA
VRCSDTQTGLRGLPASALPALIQMAGERYEYEMAMLLRLRDLGLPLVEVPIETIYLDGNRGSHFSPLRDAARIYAVIFRFALSSIVSFCVDYGLYLLLFGRLGLAAWLAYVLARLVSAAMNYALNRVVVFGPGGGRWAFARYGLVAALQLAVGTCLVHALTLWFPGGEWWIKVPVDALLFFVSYAAQRRFVFSENHSLKEE